jgi:4-amino-4-deoxy-L-arabinose transferase-like glycosyltransferase
MTGSQKGSPDAGRDGLGRRLRWTTPVLLILAGIVFALIFADYGITWDEGVQSTYGELVLDYFASGGRDTRSTEYSNLFYYGPLFESAAAATYRVVGGWKYEIRHAAIGLAALLTLVAVWRFGRLFGSSAVPFFAVLSLLMMPRFIGHAFNNSKDIPFACGFAWAMLGIGRLLTRRSWRWTDVLLCGVGIGAALSVRVGALLLLALLAGGLLSSVLLLRDERTAWRERALDRGVKLAAIVCLAWSIMVLAWPWAHAGPFTRPLVALGEMSSFTFSYTVYFAGELVRSDQLPRHYLPTYLAIVTPLMVLALATTGLVASARDRIVLSREPRSVLFLLVLLWLFLPLAFVVVTRPNVYDGIRHFLFVLPSMALLCGLGAAWILGRTARRGRLFASGLLVLALAVPLRDLVLLHPYQSSYFNALVGGVDEAWRSYDTDYWASSYREAMQWVVREAGERVGQETVVLVACNSHNRPCAEYYLPVAGADEGTAPRITMHCVWAGTERLPPGARYYVAMLRYGKAATFFPDWPVVHRIGRQGALFTVIKRRPDGTDRHPG